MAKLTVLYEFHDTHLKPFLMTIRFRPGELDFRKQTFYVPLAAPFRQLHIEDITDTEPGVSVLLEDLTVNERYPHCVGIHLQSIQARHGLADTDDALHMWIRIGDIEEVLQIENSESPYTREDCPFLQSCVTMIHNDT